MKLYSPDITKPTEVNYYWHEKVLVEPMPKPKQGEWMPIIEGNEFGETYQSGIYCSECGETLGCEANFCPNCGARMKGVDDEKSY